MSAWFWAVLGIEPTGDARAIKRAYARLLKQCRPDDDAEGFMRLRQAYEAALDHLEPDRHGIGSTAPGEADPDLESETKQDKPEPDRSPEVERAHTRADLLAGLEGLAEVDETGQSIPEPDRDHATRVFDEFRDRLDEDGPEPALAWLKERLSDREFDAPLVRHALHALALRFIIEQEDLAPSLVTGLAGSSGWSGHSQDLAPHDKGLLDIRMVDAYDALSRKKRDGASPVDAPEHTRRRKQRTGPMNAILSGIVVALISGLIASFFQTGSILESPAMTRGDSPAGRVREPVYALRQAIYEGNSEKAAAVIEQGVDLGFVYHNMQTPLMMAVNQDQYGITAQLLAAGADPNGRENHGYTALHLAVVNADPEIARLLLAAGADPLLGDPSPLSLARQMNRQALIVVFEEAIATQNQK